jgi:hypothetical protein
MSDTTAIQIRLSCGAERAFSGRPAFLLGRLIDAPSGITTGDLPAGLRVSDYVLKLRRAGVDIATQYERHGGPYEGRHARYRLAAPVQTLSREVR